jgi:Arc/MetJ-type ribon-helix-helix transcriptional regulator
MLETIPEDLQQFVRDELGSGHYRSTRDLLVESLRLLQRDRAEAAQGIQAGLNDVEAGRFQPLKEAFDDLRKQLKFDSAAWTL